MTRAGAPETPRVRVAHEPAVGSTNDRVLELARLGGGSGPVALRADVQTAGRGRLGRSWDSPRGGVWVSLAWPCRAESWVYEPAPVMAGLCVVETAVEAGASREALRVKWPNDVLVYGVGLPEGGKLSGVLCERPVAARGEGLGWLVIGVGVNTATPELRGAADAMAPAGLTEHLGVRADAGAFAQGVVARLAAWLSWLEASPMDATVAARRELSPVLAFLGERVRLRVVGAEAPMVEGVVQGVDERLRLLISGEGGTTRAFSTGEVRGVRGG